MNAALQQLCRSAEVITGRAEVALEPITLVHTNDGKSFRPLLNLESSIDHPAPSYVGSQ